MADGESLGQIETYHGVAYSDWWDFTDEDTGSPIDLTGKAYSCHIRDGTPDQPGAVVVEVTTANGKLSVASNRLTLTLTADDLGGVSGLEVGDYYYELVDLTGGPSDVIERGWWRHRPTGVGRD